MPYCGGGGIVMPQEMEDARLATFWSFISKWTFFNSLQQIPLKLRLPSIAFDCNRMQSNAFDCIRLPSIDFTSPRYYTVFLRYLTSIAFDCLQLTSIAFDCIRLTSLIVWEKFHPIATISLKLLQMVKKRSKRHARRFVGLALVLILLCSWERWYRSL